MKLAVLSDVHSLLRYVNDLHRACAAENVDAMIVCGDLTNGSGRREFQVVADALRPEHLPGFFVIGNCDQVDVDVEVDGWTNLHGRVIDFNGWLLAGMGGAPVEFDDPDFSERLQAIRETSAANSDRLIFVSHQPAFGTEADLRNGCHCGSKILRAFMDEVQPAYCFSGHIHESVASVLFGRTYTVNPGAFVQGRFGVISCEATTPDILSQRGQRHR